MARSKTPRPIHLQRTADFEVRPVPFTPFEALRNLDLKRLKAAPRAVVELGQFESDCCRSTVRAVVRKGCVIELKVDRCAASKAGKPAPEVAQLLARARKQLRTSRPAAKLPAPVGTFFRSLGGVIIDIPISWTCFVICVTVLGQRMCVTCCITRGPGAGESTSCS
jgi:hypothetical protein